MPMIDSGWGWDTRGAIVGLNKGYPEKMPDGAIRRESTY